MLGKFLQGMSDFEKLGPIYGRFVATKLLVLISDHELAKKVLLNTKSIQKYGTHLNKHITTRWGNENVLLSNGDLWKKQRSMMDPAFVSSVFDADLLSERCKPIS